jgi:hypothetical protein
VVHIASHSRLADRIGRANNYEDLEREVAVKQLPREFAVEAEFTVEAQVARALLDEMGFHSVPPAISDPGHLQLAISTTPRLEPHQIQLFLKRAIRRAV